ncbi:unnamed protein product [Brassica rapa]|uniref:Gamma tubulin complex component protein N-terminal domain-containing protein n=1 Tax=Brassica campestris TaxID=3711 RepID=A0A3P6DJL2_BRACM|nr:unnamed protein product [Brassica rapa]VDD20692.1 unnamed protein product [Brassica rapa]
MINQNATEEEDDDDHQEAADLVHTLVLRLLFQNPNPPDPTSPAFLKTLRYASRILSSRIAPSSLSPDAASIAESLKRRLATQGKSSSALAFADLYTKLASKTGPGSVANKRSLLHLLKTVSDDRKSSINSFDSSLLLTNLSPCNAPKKKDRTSNGALMISKDPENLKDIAFREYKILIKEENEVTEEVLVRDVLYACQGIDGKFVTFNSEIEGYAVVDYINTPQSMVDRLETVGQAFCAALQDELTDYYKLLAVLEAQAMNPIPLVSELVGGSSEYLSLRRLSVWFAEPMVKMRLMAVLVDKCKVLRGGAMAGAIHLHVQHGDPLVREFMMNLLRCVCSPLFEMVRSWVLEGELEDSFGEFFVVSHPVKVGLLWREGYKLHVEMLPSFISPSLAQRILRTGKSINFLRVCCDDHGWCDAALQAAAASGTTTRRGGLGYGETDALEHLVTEAALRRCQVLWNEMNHFVTNFQYYIMFEVLEVSWCNFSKEMEAARDLDDLLAAHEKYLSSIVGKSLLGEQSQTIRKSLFVLFELILRFRSHADRLYEGIYELQIRTKESGRGRNKTQESSSWISEGRKAITQRAGEFLQSMSQDMDSIAKEYTTSLDAFLSLLPLQQTVDLKFLFFRLDFTEFYSRLHFKRKES